MKTLWPQSLLIGMVTIAVGCVGPHALEERWRADGYPAEYIDGLNAGGEAFCREMLGDRGKRLLVSPEIFGVCPRINLEERGVQEPRKDRSYQQGWADGKALMSLAIDAARKANAQYMLEWQQTNFMTKDLMRDQMMRNIQAPNFNK